MSGRAPTRFVALLAFILAITSPTGARAEALVADISEHLIAITTAFAGTTVVLFGTTDGGGDIAVTVHGPREDQVVRRKERVAGIWVNTEGLAFAEVPAFYAVASSRPLAEMASEDVLRRHELGLAHVRLEPIDAEGYAPSAIATFRNALIRYKQRQELFSIEPAVVNFVGPTLFRTELAFPANVPPGLYQVQVYELRDGQVSDAQRSTLVISKVGLEADIFDFAHHQAALYGVLSIVLAVCAGWLAGVVFKRG
jgi:uncharacterized protein (TIGR02186 family)